MLLQILARVVRRKHSRYLRPAEKSSLLKEAADLMMSGNSRGAIKLLQQYLEADPLNVEALNNLGTCLADIGDNEAAKASFALAYSLDDAFVPGMVNYAKLLVDQRRTAEAMPFLYRAKISEPGFPFADTIYAAVLQSMGDAARARLYQKKSWLASFDNLRTANGHLFWMAYDDVDEIELAAEHRFWAETVKGVSESDFEIASCADRGDRKGRRIRLGYWSPDMRNHSVRYFFRPLLEGHNRECFELFLYHDSPLRDAQTDLIAQHGDHFHSVHDLSDEELRKLMRSHDLDVLIELAGHTSYNRLPLLQSRLARIQMNALGYPPTTGLPAVDAKLIDVHVITPDADRYYAERVLPLPSTFWCFNPMEETFLAPAPPQDENGFVTFGSVGNVAKITERVARAWCEIMAAVPSSRLLVRSVSFADPASIDATRERLGGWGLPIERVDFVSPKGGKDFFDSYNEIDIILDTYPFNGGTTTCFATYMGVPVITLVGHSLVSRMGLSILTNLNAADFAVENIPNYISRAIAVAKDPERVRRFKREARRIYETTALGNGTLFAQDLEQALVTLLNEEDSGANRWKSRIPSLDADELVRRAYDTMRTGQPDAARRIVAHCLREYPDCGPAHLLLAQLMVWNGQVSDAIVHIQHHLGRFSHADQVSALLAVTRMQLLRQDATAADACLAILRNLHVEDPFNVLQLKLYRACLEDPIQSAVAPLPEAASARPALQRAHFLVPCDSTSMFEAFRHQVHERCRSAKNWSLTFERCNEDDRVDVYRRVMMNADFDVLVIAQKNVSIYQANFLDCVAKALTQVDCVSFAGARRWQTLDWRTDDFAQKSGGFFTQSSEHGGMLETHFLGFDTEAVIPGMSILDGSLLALRPGKQIPDFDEALIGCDALLEEAWTHSAGEQGWKLGVHRHLGVLVASVTELNQSNRVEARLACTEKQGFDPFALMREDHSSISAPVFDESVAVRVSETFFARSCDLS